MKTLALLLACVCAVSADVYSPYLPYLPSLTTLKKEDIKYEEPKINIEPVYKPEYVALEYPFKIIGRHGFGFNIRTLFSDGLRKPLVPELLVPIKEVIEKINGEASKREYSE